MKSIEQLLAPQSTFSSGYQDERWINRAKEFRRSQGNFCRSCKRGDVPISVHHANYTPGKELWEHNDEDLTMLCNTCHDLTHKAIKAFRNIAAHCNATNIAAITGLLDMIVKKHGDRDAMLKIARIAQ